MPTPREPTSIGLLQTSQRHDQQSSFSSLPAELRLHIYGYLFDLDSQENITRKVRCVRLNNITRKRDYACASHLSITHTNRQIKKRSKRLLLLSKSIRSRGSFRLQSGLAFKWCFRWIGLLHAPPLVGACLACELLGSELA